MARLVTQPNSKAPVPSQGNYVAINTNESNARV